MGVAPRRFVYLKPPSLPTPTAAEGASPALSANPTAETPGDENSAPKARSAAGGKFVGPWQRRDPSLPKGKAEEAPMLEARLSTGTAATAVVESTAATQLSSTDLPRPWSPLSPYWRYPNLKPPSSPISSASVVRTISEFTESEGEEVKEIVTEALETESDGIFHWPRQ